MSPQADRVIRRLRWGRVAGCGLQVASCSLRLDEERVDDKRVWRGNNGDAVRVWVSNNRVILKGQKVEINLVIKPILVGPVGTNVVLV